VTKPEQCRYDAAVDVGARGALSGRPMRRTIEGGRYAALAFHGTVEEIAGAWDGLLRAVSHADRCDFAAARRVSVWLC
jgi:AraC family transcriptional regulator